MLACHTITLCLSNLNLKIPHCLLKPLYSLSTLLAVSRCTKDLTFPPGFRFGTATAAYQIEGAWNVSGKGESIWDRFTHDNPSRISDLSNGDVACDSYHNWERDIEMVEELGVHFYRFSISWSRLLPTGFPNNVSEDGKNYYNNLIDGLLKHGVEPFITLYHWQLPQALQDLGGWTNPYIADWFTDYARLVFTLFGDRVKLWLTLNEPVFMCDSAYINGFYAPGIVRPEGAYLCNKHVLLAHAKAWRLYDEEFKPKYKGKVSISNYFIWIEPASEEDKELAELALQYSAGRYCHAIYSKKGGWPPGVEKVIEENSRKRGYNKTILPAFTQEEIELIKGTYDFFGMNHYTSRLIRKAMDGETFRSWPQYDAEDLGGIMFKRDEWATTDLSWLYIYPEGIRRQLVWLKQQYGDLEFLITENGFGSYGGIEDQDRVKYYKNYLKQILLAIKEDGVNVTHYTAWSLMDNFEWTDGFTIKFGLYEVDFSDPRRRRIPRRSGRYYASVIKSHSLNVPSI